MASKPKRPILTIHMGLTERILSDAARREIREAQLKAMMDEAKDG